MVDIRSEFETVRGAKSLRTKSVLMVFLSDRKRYGLCQKVVTAELKSRGTMYRTELVSRTGTRLS